MSDDDTVVIQGCDECGGNGIVVTAPPSHPNVTPLPRQCPKCLGEGLVQNLYGGKQIPIQRPTEP